MRRLLVRTMPAVASLLAALPLAGASPAPLENVRLAVELDSRTGAIAAVRDKETRRRYRWPGRGFVAETDRGTLWSVRAAETTRGPGSVTFVFREQGFEARLHYRLGPDDAFVEKWVELQRTDGEPFVLKRVLLEDVRTGTTFREIRFHDDNTIWHCPINLFLRAEAGGCYAGLAYPWWDYAADGAAGFRLGYRPNCRIPAGATHVGERFFLGVYRREGIVRYSHGPYPGRAPTRYLSFNGSGLSQHFKHMRIPSAAVAPEVLDWGEVWAMQEFMRRTLPEQPLPEDGFWVWQNGWWAGLFEPKTEILDHLKAAGVHDIMTAHTWYGRGNHPMPEPYLSQTRPAPLGFPTDAAVAGMPGPAGPAAGLHAPHDVRLDQFKAGEYTADFRAPPAMQAFWEYGRSLGVHVSSFSLPGLWIDAKPEWGAVSADGRPSEYLFGRRVSCPACGDYMRHLRALHEAVFAKYEPRWWGWDGRWMSYWEVGGYRPGAQDVGPDPCYAANHGHVPGDNFYAEWQNILQFVADLRRQRPRMCLEQYLGLKRGGPWALRHFNADDNYFESNGADMNRFQTWHNQNDRFRPVHKNYAAIFGESPAEFQFSLLSTISVATYGQLGPAFKALAHEGNRAFLKQWRAWATDHYEFLKVKRDLFDCPGLGPIDGSAHILGNRGYLFFFPAGVHTPDPAVAERTRSRTGVLRASVPLNRWIGLDATPRARYRLTELYPRENHPLGVWAYDADFHYDVPRDSAAVVELAPARREDAITPIARPADAGPVHLIRAFATQAPTEAPPASGPPVLRAHFRFDDRDPQDASTPNAASSGGRVALGPHPLAEGRVGRALQLDGRPGQAVDLGDLALAAPATVALWLKRTAAPPAFADGDALPEYANERARSQGRLFSQLSGDTAQAGSVRMGPDRLEVWDGAAWQTLAERSFPADEWLAVVLVFGGDGTVAAYVNGQPAGTALCAFDFNGVRFGLGAGFLKTYGHPWPGCLDDVRLYRGALPAQAVARLFQEPGE